MTVHYGAPPTAPVPPVPPRKKKSAWPIILAVLGGFALLCIGGVVITTALGGNDKANGGTSNTADSKKATTATIGQAARDGQFEFTVTKVQCGVAKVGDDFLEKKAQGQYCLITITVKNIGKEPRTLSDSNQKAFDAAGREFSTDEAGIYVKDNDTVFLNNINPGNSATGIVVFDIPKDGKLTKLELHDSAFSGGIEVSLA